MDRELADSDRQRIRAVVLAHPDARDLQDLRTRQSGNQAFIQFHLELDPRMSLREAHRISDEIEAQILALFPGAEVIIHQDPAGIARSEEHTSELQSLMRISYAVFCLTKKTSRHKTTTHQKHRAHKISSQ